MSMPSPRLDDLRIEREDLLLLDLVGAGRAAGERIATGDRLRVDGSAGSVQILERASADTTGPVRSPIGPVTCVAMPCIRGN